MDILHSLTAQPPTLHSKHLPQDKFPPLTLTLMKRNIIVQITKHTEGYLAISVDSTSHTYHRMSNMGRTASLRKLAGSELVAVPL